jgi:hypothetical protein
LVVGTAQYRSWLGGAVVGATRVHDGQGQRAALLGFVDAGQRLRGAGSVDADDLGAVANSARERQEFILVESNQLENPSWILDSSNQINF